MPCLLQEEEGQGLKGGATGQPYLHSQKRLMVSLGVEPGQSSRLLPLHKVALAKPRAITAHLCASRLHSWGSRCRESTVLSSQPRRMTLPPLQRPKGTPKGSQAKGGDRGIRAGP